MTYFTPSTNKWVKAIAITEFDFETPNWVFDGFNTIFLANSYLSPAVNGVPARYYGLDFDLGFSFLGITLNEANPSKLVYAAHNVTPPANTDDILPWYDGPLAYDPLRNRIYVSVSSSSSTLNYRLTPV
jgi:hypothetical protein